MRIVVVYVQKIRKVGSSDEKLVGAGLTITALYRSIVGLGGGGGGLPPSCKTCWNLIMLRDPDAV